MNRFFLSLGSNIRPDQNIPECLKLLKQTFHVKKISTVYETQPVGPAGPSPFWNCVVEIESDDDTEQLHHKLRELETRQGRQRDPANKFSPRTIDVDILPQDSYQKFAFIMIPLAEVAPEDKDLETGKTFRELAEALKPEQAAFRKIETIQPLL